MVIISGIYRITCLSNNKIYIGQAINAKQREKSHFSQLRRGKHENRKLQKDFCLFGEQNFIFELITACDPEYLSKKERDSLRKEIECGHIFYNSIKKAGLVYDVEGSLVNLDDPNLATVILDAPTHAALRFLSEKEKRSQAQIIELAVEEYFVSRFGKLIEPGGLEKV